MVDLGPFQNTNRLQGHRNIAAQTVLAVPRATIGNDSLLGDFQKGLVIVDHHRTIPQQLSPQTGVGGLPRAALGSEQIRLPIHGHHGTVEQQGVILEQLLGNFPLHGGQLQIAVGELPHGNPLRFILPHRLDPLKVNILLGDDHGEINHIRRIDYVVFAISQGIVIQGSHPDSPPREI